MNSLHLIVTSTYFSFLFFAPTFDLVCRSQVLTHLFYVLNTIKKTERETESMRQLIISIHRMNPRNSCGDSLLHLVVSKSNTMKSNTFIEDPHTVIFPDPGVCELLIDCGGYVDAVNYNHSTPLHVACTRSNYNAVVVDILLRAGAHIDRRNATGNQPNNMLSSISECKINPLRHITLKCLCARKIVEHNVPFVGLIPIGLEDYIRMH